MRCNRVLYPITVNGLASLNQLLTIGRPSAWAAVLDTRGSLETFEAASARFFDAFVCLCHPSDVNAAVAHFLVNANRCQLTDRCVRGVVRLISNLIIPNNN